MAQQQHPQDNVTVAPKTLAVAADGPALLTCAEQGDALREPLVVAQAAPQQR